MLASSHVSFEHVGLWHGSSSLVELLILFGVWLSLTVTFYLRAHWSHVGLHDRPVRVDVTTRDPVLAGSIVSCLGAFVEYGWPSVAGGDATDAPLKLLLRRCTLGSAYGRLLF